MSVQDVEKALLSKGQDSTVPDANLLSVGSALINLACSGRVVGAFPKGEYVWFVGDSNSGKTWFTMNCFAEASVNKNFDGYDLVYNGPEGGALMNVAHYFGEKLCDRLQMIHTPTIEEFYFDSEERFQKPTILALDSMDSLTSLGEVEKLHENRKLLRKGRELKGLMNTNLGKAKQNSSGIRQLNNALKSSGSILIIINQSREMISDMPMMGGRKTYAGGNALRFYACVEVWTSVREKIKKVVNGRKRTIGTMSRVQVRRSRLTGGEGDVEVPIYKRTGIDDVGSCIDYLLLEKHWKVPESYSASTIFSASEFGFKGTREELIQQIESGNEEEDLHEIVQTVWNDIEDRSQVKRKRRYE